MSNESKENVLGLTPLEDKEEEPQPERRMSMTEEPEEMLPEEDDEAQEAASEEEAPEAEEEEVLESVLERFEKQEAKSSETELLRQQIADLKAAQAKYEGELAGRDSVLNKVIGGEPKEPDPLEDFNSPAVAELVRRARETDDPAEELRLHNQIAEKIAEHKVEQRLKPLEERLAKQQEDAQIREDVSHREQQMAYAMQYLESLGGVNSELVKQVRTKGADSLLMRSWLSSPGMTADYRSMVLAGAGLAGLVERAAQNGNGEPIKQVEKALQQPSVDATSVPKPKASKRGDELNKPKVNEEDKMRETVIARLRAAGGTGAASATSLLDSL